MSRIVAIDVTDWEERCPAAVQVEALHRLEDGSLLLFPRLRFALREGEAGVFSPATLAAGRKNVSCDANRGDLRGSSLVGAAATPLRDLMQRFAEQSSRLLEALLPPYGAGAIRARTSFRPADLTGRAASWREDDSRLHVDSFATSPVQGKRILRVFSNVDPHGRGRHWRLGEPFDRVAERYLSSLPRPMAGSSLLLRLLRRTKSRRSAYDHYMLQLHDRMKASAEYQAMPDQTAVEFPAGSTWMAFTDQVSHAAMAGQYVLEQTFLLPLTHMADEAKSPLRILERLTRRQLA